MWVSWSESQTWVRMGTVLGLGCGATRVIRWALSRTTTRGSGVTWVDAGAGEAHGFGMRRYLVVANLTVTEPHLLDTVRDCMAAGEASFHIVVPASHPHGAWTESAVNAAAEERLTAGLAAFAELGANVTGEVGDVSPVRAVGDVLLRDDFDEIILSTLPPGPSRWLKQDVVSRIVRRFDVPVTHVVASPQLVQ